MLGLGTAAFGTRLKRLANKGRYRSDAEYHAFDSLTFNKIVRGQ